MAEYIERNELINNRPEMRNPHQTGKEEYNAGWNDCVEAFLDAIKDQSAADVEPVKHGEWKYIKSGEGVFDYYFECSECHANTPNKAYPTNPDFCPHCGSKNVSLDCGICCLNYKDGKEVQE